MAPPTNCPKIKPYTVIDLSTHTVLSEDEISKVLNQATEKEYLKSIGEYAYNGNHAKENGDPPNFLLLPPKKRSKSLGSLFDAQKLLKEGDQLNKINEKEKDDNGYSELPFRGRSNTAPTGYQKLANHSNVEPRMKKLSKVSRLTTPSSPGVAKRKVQQKLQQQRNAKQQQQQQQQQLLGTSPRSISKPSGLASNMSQKQSGLRMPSSRIPSSGIPNGIATTSSADPPRSQSALRAPEASSKANRIPQANQRSTLPRLYKKTDVQKTQVSVNNNNDGPSLRASMSQAATRATASDCTTTTTAPSGLQQPRSIGKPTTKSALPTRGGGTSTGEKRSLESLRMGREKSTDNFSREKSADNLRINRDKSSDSIRKVSSSSVPCSRTKQSFENLSRENTADNLRVKNESHSSISSSSISSSTDSVECSKSTGHLSTGLKKPQTSVATTKSLTSLKKPGTTGIASPRKYSAPPPPSNPTSKVSKAPSTGISKPSGITKPSGIVKPSTGSSLQKPGVSGLSQPNHFKKKSPEVPVQVVVNGVKNQKGDTPASARKQKPSSLLEPSPTNRRASDSGVQMQTKSKLEVAPQKKKLSDISNAEESINVVNDHDERDGLKHPTVGKISDKIIEPSMTSKLKRPLQFKPNTSSNNSSGLKKPSYQKSENKIPTVSGVGGQQPLKRQSEQQAQQQQQQQRIQNQSQKQDTVVVHSNDTTFSLHMLETASNCDDNSRLAQANDEIQQQSSEIHATPTTTATAIHRDENNYSFDENNEDDDDDDDDFGERVDSTDPFTALDRNNVKNTTYPTSPDSISTSEKEEDSTSTGCHVEHKNTVSAGLNQNTDLKLSRQTGTSDINYSMREGDMDINVNKNNLLEDGYTEPDDCIKRSDQLSSDSGYIEPLDALSSSPSSSTIQLRTQTFVNSSEYSESTGSSNESDPSPSFGLSNYHGGNRTSGELLLNHQDERRSNTSSQMKRNQPIIVHPPPQIESYDDNDLLAPVPKEYMRTPSSDIEEFNLIKNSPVDTDLRQKARQQAIRVWKNKNIPQDEFDGTIGGEGMMGDEDDDQMLMDENGEYLDADVFYPSHPFEQKTNTLERYAVRTSIRRSSEDEQFSMEENIRQLETIALERKGKKTSKLKKFFKKLSSKKDSSSTKVENDNFVYHHHHHQQYQNHHQDHHHLQQKSDVGEIIHMSASSNGNLKARRKSDGTISVFSVNDINTINSAVTPLTKRRLFAINLSFMKRGKRQRSNTTVLNTSDTNGTSTSARPSEIVRALCSPEMARRKNNFTSFATNGRRASDPSIYRVQHNSTSSVTSSRSHFHSTSTSIKIPSTKKYRAPMPPSGTSPPVTFTLTPSTLTTLTTTASTTMTTTDTENIINNNNVAHRRHVFPLPARGSASSEGEEAEYMNYPIAKAYAASANNKRLVFPRPSRGSTSSDGEEADYINYPFSKANVKPPVKPSRNGSKGSCSEPPQSGHHRSSSIGGTTKSSSIQTAKNPRQNRHSSVTSDDSLISSESIASSQGTNGGDAFDQNSVVTARLNNNGSLRRTPLRHSVDSYNKLLEVHRQTIDKIAVEVSRLVCNCEQLHDSSWNDYDRKNDVVQLGVESYMVLPVSSSKVEQKTYTAWLRLDQQHASTADQHPTHINYASSTLHRNCLHICHSIEPTYATPFEESLPKSIEVNTAFISSQIPKMALSRYVAMTMEKHTRYPELYERETALILLQVVKGVSHLMKKRVPLKSITPENVFILNTGDPSIILSPRKEPNKCPAVVVACLPGLGDNYTSTSSTDNVTTICHQLAFLLYQLLHSPYEEELRLIINSPMLFTTLPDLTIKSIYSRYLQSVIDKLLGSTTHTMSSLDELMLTLEVFLFGPTNISDHSEREGVNLIQKWHNRRCVDMVTHILKEAPLIMLCASEHQGQEVERIKTVDQEILLECEFLSTVFPADIFRVSKELHR